MGKVSFTLRMDEEVKAELDALAAAQDRPVAWVVNRAVERMLARVRAEDDAIRRSIAQADAGQTIGLETVMVEMESWAREGDDAPDERDGLAAE